MDRELKIAIFGERIIHRRNARNFRGMSVGSGSPVLIAVNAHRVGRLLDLPPGDPDPFTDRGEKSVQRLLEGVAGVLFHEKQKLPLPAKW